MLAITGVPGSGKTYYVVKSSIIPLLKEGRKVVTNIQLDIDELKDHGINTDNLINFELNFFYNQITKGAVYVIDDYSTFKKHSNKKRFIDSIVASGSEPTEEHVDNDGNITTIILIFQHYRQIEPLLLKHVTKSFIIERDLIISSIYYADLYRHKFNSKLKKSDKTRIVRSDESFDYDFFNFIKVNY